MKRAFHDLTVKSFDEDEGIIRGIATTPAVDRVGDIVIPKGAKFKLPLPLLFNHDHSDPIGEVIEARVTDAGIEIVAKVARVTDHIKDIWARIKAGLIKGLSVGFIPEQASKNNQGGDTISAWNWVELSVCTIPANVEGQIQLAKAAPQIENKAPQGKGKPSMTIAEQIKQFEAKRMNAKAKCLDLAQKSADEARVLNADEEAEYATAEAEMQACEKHLSRLKTLEGEQAKSAKPVGVPHISVESNMPKGAGFVAATKALIQANGHPEYAVTLAKQHYRDNPEVEQFIRQKAATTTTQPSLIKPGSLAGEFIDLLRDATIVGRLPGMRPVPHGTPIPRLTQSASAFWVGEGERIGQTTIGTGDIDISRFKVGAIAPTTRELMELGNPAIDALLRDNLIEAASEAIDLAFITPTNAGSANKPASIVYGLAPVASSGDTANAARADVMAVFKTLTDAKQSVAGSYWIMNTTTAAALTFMKNAAGNSVHAGMSIDGGTYEGLPAIVSDRVPAGEMVLVKPSEIFTPLVPSVGIDVSREATLSVDAGNGEDLNLFEQDMIALRVISYTGWHARRAPCAVRITGVAYDASKVDPILTVAATAE